MIDLTLNQPLLASPSSRRGAIAPGLLRVLQQAVAIRLVLAVLALGVFGAVASGWLPAQQMAWVPILLVIEAIAYLGFVTWSRVRDVLGRWFLPAALGWFLLAPIVEQALLFTSLPPVALDRLGSNGLPGVGIEAILLVVPVILATWQYGRRGWIASLGVLAIGHLALAVLIGQDAMQVGVYVVAAAGRLAMIALLGYIVMQLVAALRAEHDALSTANRRLTQRAATVEQLAASRERNRLARELHDTLAHSLTGLSVQLQAVETLMNFDPPAAAVQLKEAQATVRSGIQESRRAIQALRASPLEDLGLSEALRQLCRRQAERMDIPMDCAIAAVEALDPLTEQAVYRVAEAALANVERHAAATLVRVSLARSLPSGRLRLEIRDNGTGFDPADVRADRFGLTGMAEWAELAGADLQIETMPTQGTMVALEIRE